MTQPIKDTPNILEALQRRLDALGESAARINQDLSDARERIAKLEGRAAAMREQWREIERGDLCHEN